MAKQIFVERETFEKNGRTFFSYFIRGNIRGKDVKVAVVPPDKGGYTVLDIVFGNEMAAELISRWRSFRPTKVVIPCWISCSATRWRRNSF